MRILKLLPTFISIQVHKIYSKPFHLSNLCRNFEPKSYAYPKLSTYFKPKSNLDAKSQAAFKYNRNPKPYPVYDFILNVPLKHTPKLTLILKLTPTQNLHLKLT